MNLNKLSDNQLRVIAEALDLYSRILSGQVEEVGTVVWRKSQGITSSQRPSNKALLAVKRDLFPALGDFTSYGIGSSETPDDAKTAYDVYQVVDRYLHPHASVNQGKIFNLTKEDLPQLEDVK